jgi:hypothetical protein
MRIFAAKIPLHESDTFALAVVDSDGWTGTENA